MRILQTNFFGDHNLGLLAEASDRVCLGGNIEKLEKIEAVLKVSIRKVSIARTDLIGIFCCMNSKGILLSKVISDSEFENFKRIGKEFGLDITVLKSKFTSIGNLILCNDNGAIINKRFSNKDKRVVEDCLDVESRYSAIAGMNIVGSCGVATNKGCVIHRDAKENEIKTIEEILKVNVDIGTANFGSPFVGSCLFANSNGAVIGESTTGPEVARIMETLDLI